MRKQHHVYVLTALQWLTWIISPSFSASFTRIWSFITWPNITTQSMSLAFPEHWADKGFSPGSSNCPWFLRLTISVQTNELGHLLRKLQNTAPLGPPWLPSEWDVTSTHPSFFGPDLLCNNQECHTGDSSVQTSLLSLDLHSDTTTASGGPS